jgi:hypothetical protein
MARANYQEAIPLRYCCATGAVEEYVAIPTSGDYTNIPLSRWYTRSDSSLYTFSDGAIQVNEAGTYLISASAYFIPGKAGETKHLTICNGEGKYLADAQHWNYNVSQSNAIGISPRLVCLSAGQKLRLIGAGKYSTASSKIAIGNTATFLTVIKVG